MNEISVNFGLESEKDLVKFFPREKTIPDRFAATFQRIRHSWATGIWINENALCDFAKSHKDLHLSRVFEGRVVQRKLIRIEGGVTLAKKNMVQRVTDAAQFVAQFANNPETVGAILPSSPWLAKAIVSELPKDLKASPRTILEVGPGTGSFTDKIVKRMNPGDQLHLVEFDAEFAATLREKYAHISNVTIFHCSILDFEPSLKYDCIISGLPLNAFTVDFVRNVFAKFCALANENTTVSYFEYIGIPKVKMLLSTREEKQNLGEVLKVKKQFYKAHKLRKENVLLNVPCARVRHHKITDTKLT